MVRQVTPLLEPYPDICGVILSNGDGLAQGEFFGESARSGTDCYGFRRVLRAARVRETMIVSIPGCEGGGGDASTLNVGWNHGLLGDYEQAREDHRQWCGQARPLPSGSGSGFI
jgi:hypothetical protein